jgi:hypothetical protein
MSTTTFPVRMGSGLYVVCRVSVEGGVDPLHENPVGFEVARASRSPCDGRCRLVS